GILSERDYARKIVLEGRSSKDTPVRDIMTAEVITVGPDHSVPACMQMVTKKRIRHLPVVEGGSIVGIISIGDLVKAVIEDQRHGLGRLPRYVAGGPAAQVAGEVTWRSGRRSRCPRRDPAPAWPAARGVA